MAAIPYLKPGASLTAAHWTTIFQAADAALTTALGGASAVLALMDKPWDRSFWFFDPTNLPATLHPLAQTFLSPHLVPPSGSALYASFGPPNQQGMFFRLYSDATVATALAALTVGTPSPLYGVAPLTPPTWTAWMGTVYPSGFSGLTVLNGTPIDGLVDINTSAAAVNLLDVSLKVNTVTVSGTPYKVTLLDVTTAEHAQPYKPIDVFINAAFTWSSSWNKYSMVRVHNCARTAQTATFGAASKTLAPGASWCVRLVKGAWQANGNYFHWMDSGDPHFLQCLEATGGAAAPMQPSVIATVFQAVLTNATTAGTTNFGGYFNAVNFWDLSPIYNNASYTPDAYENTPPSGGYLPALSLSALLGDLLIPKGKILAANRLIAPTQAQINFTGFGAGFATLSAALTAAGVTSKANGSTWELYYSNGSNRQDLIDLSSALITFITGGNPAAFNGATQSSSPKSLLIPTISLIVPTVTSGAGTTDWTYSTWAVDGGGNPYVSGTVTVTVTNAGSTLATHTTALPVTDSVTAAFTAGGPSTLNYNVLPPLSTPFGPVLLWQESWPLDAKLNGIQTLTNAFIVAVQLNGRNLNVIRARFLGDGFNIWPPRTAAGMAWNFARTDQWYSFQRFFYHASGDPMMPAWGIGSSAYACVKYDTLTPAIFVDPPYYALFEDTLSSGEFNFIKSFYETTPITTDTPWSLANGSLAKMTGISRLGAFSAAGDCWPLFVKWYTAAGNLTYPIQPDLGGSITIPVANTGNDTTDWYSLSTGPTLINNGYANFLPVTVPGPTLAGASVYGNSTTWQNVLPCQIEHINLLASLINALPPMVFEIGEVGNSTFTLDFSAANILIVNGGSGYAVNDTIDMGVQPLYLKVASIGAGGAVASVSQVSGHSGQSIECFAYSTLPRPFATTTNNAGSGLTIDTSAGTSALSFLPTYNPVGVPTPPGTDYGLLWPRAAYFAWNGPSISGAYDPVGLWLTSLGLTVESSLPDSYGTPVLNTWTNLPGLGTSTDGSYYGGFTPDFQTAAASYRWVTISDAQTLYANLGVTFILNGLYAPQSFASVLGTCTYYVQPGCASTFPIANFRIINQCGFYNDADGIWLMTPATDPPILRNQIRASTITIGLQNEGGPPSFGVTITYGVLNLQGNSYGVPAAYTALTALLAGLPVAQLFARLPQNYAYYDPAFVTANLGAFAALGNNIIPAILDNTVESDQAEITILGGPGDATQYDFPLATALANARVVQIPLDAATAKIDTQGTGNPGKGGLNMGNTTGAGGSGTAGAGGGL